MLHVTLDELPRGRGKKVRATQLRTRVHERQHVLKLIAKTERASWLVWTAARPHAAGQRLVQEPAIHDEIE
jgi:hypothetical protein